MEKTLCYQINKERLLDTIKASSSIGTSRNGGLNRLALSEEDKKMRELFIDWLTKEGLKIRIDDFGNIYGRREGKRRNGPVVAFGSHLDTQPNGGRFDGVLGVLIGLEVIRVLNENDIETEYPIEIINFTNEEGARFSPPMLGSGGVAEAFSKEFIYHSTDTAGITYEQALEQIGYKGKKENRLREAKNFIELHIEQGPILDKKDKEIGVVMGIQGMSWLTVKVIGETNHAGPTPMEDRKDALIPAAKMISKVNGLADEVTGLKTTIGRMDVKPNIPNVIPGEVEFSIDIRHENDDIRYNSIETLKERLSTIAFMNNVDITITEDWNSDAVHFSNTVIQTIEKEVEKMGYSSIKLFSGPGHDAKYMSSLADTGMIFIPSKDGISHNECEFSNDADIEKGANVLLYTICELANINKK
ncbi:Zn-dependent hydrolase [Oceanobacillus oncorhynchi subsp. incaldanensis]|uniref:M20 family metallo-hydrolase n=1 Tax=Oceanobacillus oncorhynchi TaxID=545501 RepID=UPI001AFD137B|nr:M20 family metallo-hydrolase [Oceanobacillus oncorhynchi]GIO19672.1 Zn-dependent hydrolase [Oceanobacillus oncorhynchi subsp. incaldanensis]